MSHETPRSQNALMDLRIITLRTIADVWNDDNFESKENKNAWSRILEQKLITKKIYDELEKSNIPVKDTLRLTLGGSTVTKGLDAHQLKEYFNIRYGYLGPFPSFGTQFIPGTALWNKYGLHTWSKPEGETITVSLPNKRCEWNETDKTERLMEYYNHFPSFFGSTSEPNKKTDPPKSTRDNEMNLLVNAEGTVDLTGNNYDLGVSQDEFLSFGAVVIKIIACAWSDPKFLNEIDYEKHNSTTNDTDYFQSISIILQEQFQFTNPWAFNIKFEFRDDYWVESSEGNIHWNTPEAPIIRNSVSLEIPISPPKSGNDMSFALAKYNAIGPAYPFTCS